MTLQNYDSFLRDKMKMATADGLDIDMDMINPAMKPHCRIINRWALKGGRRAIFANFGLHKTAMQIDLMRVIRKVTGGLCLIVLPLGVRQEFFGEAKERFTGDFAVRLKFIQSMAEITAADRDAVSEDVPLVLLTNYESAREGKIDPSQFTGVSLDEAAVLRGYSSIRSAFMM